MNTLLVVPWDEKRGGVQAVVNTVAGWLEKQDHSVLMLHNGQSLRLKFGTTKLGYRGVKLRLSWPFATQSRGLLSAMVFPLVFLLILVQLVWLLRTRRIDIVNLHYPIDNFIYFAICRRLLPIRLVTSIHGRDAFERDRPLKKYSRALGYIVRSSDLIILPSDAYRRMLATSLPTLHDRIVYIHNSVDPSRFKPADAGSAAALSPYILCIAELQEYKGIDVLLHATQLLLETDPDLMLILAGDGPLRQPLEDLALALGIRHRVLFLGTQGVPELVTLLHGCRVAVLPSRMEPFGIAILEALACRRPVVACAVGGIPEMIEHEVSGLLVEPEDPKALAAGLRRVLDDEKLAYRLAANGYAGVMERFRSVHQGAAYERTFRSLLRPGSAEV